ncbi:MAG: hypothetical protein ACJAVI_001959 [Candidatus Azotimanducaceae bacterium]|jgi:hypothetical protein
MAAMWKMTLKQRRRQRELIADLDALKRSPYSSVPPSYSFGEDLEEDKKYEDLLKSLSTILQEMHQLEEAARDSG